MVREAKTSISLAGEQDSDAPRIEIINQQVADILLVRDLYRSDLGAGKNPRYQPRTAVRRPIIYRTPHIDGSPVTISYLPYGDSAAAYQVMHGSERYIWDADDPRYFGKQAVITQGLEGLEKNRQRQGFEEDDLQAIESLLVQVGVVEQSEVKEKLRVLLVHGSDPSHEEFAALYEVLLRTCMMDEDEAQKTIDELMEEV